MDPRWVSRAVVRDKEYGVTHILDLGLPGLQLAEGDHICAFYRGPTERDQILIPYLQAGLRTGDKCICVVDAVDPQEVLAALGSEADVNRWISETQLELRASTDAYLRSGRFCMEEMLAFWDNFEPPRVWYRPYFVCDAAGVAASVAA